MKRHLTIILAQPRGFCTGVERALKIVEDTLKQYGEPIYVLHEIVHNKYIVDTLRNKGVIFVKDLNEAPNKSVIIFSAHGVSKEIEEEAVQRKLNVIDATCPLVKKVHTEAKNYESKQKEVLIIGHKGHAEVSGTAGRLTHVPIIISSEEEAEHVVVNNEEHVAFVTQTTLNVDDTATIVAILKRRFPKIISPGLNDICYATKSRQDAVKQLTKEIDVLLVVGSKNSSNSNRLREVGEKEGTSSYLIDGPQDIDLNWLANAKTLGITAGASAPEVLVQEVIKFLSEHFEILVQKEKTST